jgi:hypothetical protein
MEWERMSPVLHAAYRLLSERPGANPDEEHVAALLPDMERADVTRALMLLRDTGYVGGYVASGPRVDLISATEKGLRATMGWPGPDDVRGVGADVLLKALDERIAQAETPDERTRVKRIRDAVADTGQGVVTEVLAAWLARMTGMG